MSDLAPGKTPDFSDPAPEWGLQWPRWPFDRWATTILVIGLVLPKLVCFICGLIAGQPVDALMLQVVGLYFLSSGIVFNLLDAVPFVALAKLDARAYRLRSTAIWWGTLVGAWLGLLGPLMYLHCHMWWGIFGHGFNSEVLMVYIYVPIVTVIGMWCGACIGFVCGLCVHMCRRNRSTSAQDSGRV
jgi:hypothetical protein